MMTKQEIKARIETLTTLVNTINRTGRAAYKTSERKREIALLRWRLRNKRYVAA